MKMKAPAGVTSFSSNGEEHAVKRGHCDVPDAAVADAMAFGFTAVEASAAKTEEAGADEGAAGQSTGE